MRHIRKHFFLLISSLSLIAGISYLAYSQLNPLQFPKYRFAISNIHDDLGQKIKELEEKISQNPKAALELSALATLQISQARTTGDPSFYKKAESNAERSLQILPHFNDQSLLVLARVAEAKHQFDKAISLATKTILVKSNTEALSILVTSYLAQGNLKEASVRADQLIDEKPGVSSYPLRALVLEAQGRKEEADYDYQRALFVEDLGELFHSAWARALLARFYLKNRNLPSAEELLTESLRIYPKYPLALDLMGELEIQRNNYKKAGDIFFQAFLITRQVTYLRHYARAKELAGDNETALAARAEAEQQLRNQLKWGDYGHREELVSLLLEKNSKESAKEALNLIQKEVLTRKTAREYHLLAKSFMVLHDWVQAQEAIQGALRTGVRDFEIYSDAAHIEGQLGSKQRESFFRKLSRG
ncbi:hypothetical protein EBQ74_00875 [bacterium]|nr:hypothetical protein [bacterium]